MNTGMEALVFEKTFFMGEITHRISAMDLSPNNNLLASGDPFGKVELWKDPDLYYTPW